MYTDGMVMFITLIIILAIYPAALYLVLKLLKIKNPGILRFIGVSLGSGVAIATAWGLAQYFIPLGIVGLVLQWALFKYLLRISAAKAIGAMFTWDGLVVVGVLIAGLSMLYLERINHTL